MKGASKEAAREAKGKALAALAKLETLTGVGLCRVGEGYGVRINLSESPSPSVKLPQVIDGVPVVIEVVGRIVKQTLAVKRAS